VFPAKGKPRASFCIVGIQLTIGRFGWVNASYIYGMTLISAHMKRALGALTTWDTFEQAMSDLGMV
jgi:hypothetical protein